MYYKKMGLLILLFLVIIISGLLIYNKATKVDNRLTDYEIELINYFKEVALKSEYDENINRTIKWEKPMLLYVEKDSAYDKQMDIIQKIIYDINSLVRDDFKIELSDDISKSNAILYLIDKEKVEKIESNFFKGIDEDFVGLTEVELNDRYNIIKAKIFIDTKASIDIQESALLEEITQSIGLMNDSNKYANSIFYQDQIEEGKLIKKYSRLDKDIIKLLYHPKMKSGLDILQSEEVIKKILKEPAPDNL